MDVIKFGEIEVRETCVNHHFYFLAFHARRRSTRPGENYRLSDLVFRLGRSTPMLEFSRTFDKIAKENNIFLFR